MTVREALLIVLLVLSSAAVTVGVAHWSVGVAWIVAGVLVAAVSVVALTEVRG